MRQPEVQFRLKSFAQLLGVRLERVVEVRMNRRKPSSAALSSSWACCFPSLSSPKLSVTKGISL